MTETVASFNWDDGNREKCRKHGVTLEEIESAFLNGTMRVFPDTAHSASETRYLAIARIAADRRVLVAFTYRKIGKHRFIRPISARFMHAKEIKHYETQGQDSNETA